VVPAAPVAWAGLEALAVALDADAARLERAEAADLDADAAGEPVETVELAPGTTGAGTTGAGTTGAGALGAGTPGALGATGVTAGYHVSIDCLRLGREYKNVPAGAETEGTTTGAEGTPATGALVGAAGAGVTGAWI
jgi:hypothetical protein